MIIEFLGTPGAGKTTLHDALAYDLRRRGLAVLTRADLERILAARTAAGRAAALLPSARVRGGLLRRLAYQRAQAGRLRFEREQAGLLAYVRAVQAQRPEEAGAERRRVLPLFLNMAGKVTALQALAQPGEIVLLDEAFVHRVVQFYASHVEDPDPDAIREYLALVPPPDVLVWVDAPALNCLARVQGRGVWEHSRHLRAGELALFVARAQAVTHIAADEARRKGWAVIEIYNNGTPEQAAAELIAAVEQYLR